MLKDKDNRGRKVKSIDDGEIAYRQCEKLYNDAVASNESVEKVKKYKA